MRVVLDTNVFVSAVFFSGVPGKILGAWRDGRITLVTSPEILEEYRRVGDYLRTRYDGVDLDPFLALAATEGFVVEDLKLTGQICEDPDDDKFLACALASGAPIIVSGDKHLLRATGWHGIEVLTPRKFLEGHLGND